MDYRAYVINLEHASERWEHVRRTVEERGIPYVRIDGVYGKKLPRPIEGYDGRLYRIVNGKEASPGEVGCYFSHLKALRAFLAAGEPYALVLEDDITLPPHSRELLAAAIAYGDDWDLLRLTSSREGAFFPIGELPGNHRLAYNTRVLKNTGAYLINRDAAQRCVAGMLPMKRPFDLALDREWDFGFRTACVIPFPIRCEEAMDSQIARAKRIRLYRSTTFHLFHALARIERACHRKKQIREWRRRQGR